MRWLTSKGTWTLVLLMALSLSAGSCTQQPAPVAKSGDPSAEKAQQTQMDDTAKTSPPVEKAADPPAEKPPAEKPPEAGPLKLPDPPVHPEEQPAEKAIEKAGEKPAYGETAKEAPPVLDPFKDWPAPQALLILSGNQLGYIEPCGCAGLENQKGGLKRRHTFVKQMHERGWPVALFDLGEQVRRYGAQQEIKYRKAIQSLSVIGYQGVGFGQNDLQLPAEQVLLLSTEVLEDKPLFVSANVTNQFAPQAILPYRVVAAGQRKIGVTTVLGKSFAEQIRNDAVTITPAEEAIAAVLPKLKAEADFLVLMANATLEEAKELGKKFPEFDLVVTTSTADVPQNMELIAGTEKTQLIDVGAKGMCVAAVGLFDDAKQPVRYVNVELDKRYADSPEMQKIFVEYQNEIKAIGLEGLVPTIRPAASGAEFVGSEKCGACHTKAFEIWKNTPHAHALDTLTRLKPQRQFDPECLSCHVTGWELNPQAHVPLLSGYLGEKKTPHLFGNGCENCHGPGSAHVAAESGDVAADQKMLDDLRAKMRLPLAMAEATCVKCHDGDNSPEFGHEPTSAGELKGFAEYWKRVEHKGKD